MNTPSIIEVFRLGRESGMFEKFFQVIPDMAYVIDLNIRKIIYINAQFTETLGYNKDDLRRMDDSMLPFVNYPNPQELFDEIHHKFEHAKSDETLEWHLPCIRKDGQERIIRNRGRLLFNTLQDKVGEVIMFGEDVTDNLLVIENMRQKQILLSENEKIFNYGSWEWKAGHDYVWWSDGLFRLFGYDKTEFETNRIPYGFYEEFIGENDRKKVAEMTEQAISNKKTYYEFEHELVDARGDIKQILVRVKNVFDENGNLEKIFSTSTDVSTLRMYEVELRNKIDHLKAAYQLVNRNDILLEEAESLVNGGYYNYNIIKGTFHWSEGLYKIYGFSLNNRPDEISFDYFMSLLHEEDKSVLWRNLRKTITHGKPFEVELEITDQKGEEKTLIFRAGAEMDANKKVVKVYGSNLDITHLKQSQRVLELKVEELSRSNTELEQFAYVASHDLQEPLRKITAFGERLNSKFGSELGDDGKFYVNRMNSAANRMKILIENLLAYSRISRKTEPFVEVNLNEIVKNVLNDSEIKIEEKEATIECDNLPTLEALPSQMQQLFQNLINNALKFTKAGVLPKVVITATLAKKEEIKHFIQLDKTKQYYKISVKDNGIGFDPAFAEKIFVIFQRLHGRSEFEGTGLGLAICKKIVDNHEGFIYAQSVPNKGAEFVLFLPTMQEL